MLKLIYGAQKNSSEYRKECFIMLCFLYSDMNHKIKIAVLKHC